MNRNFLAAGLVLFSTALFAQQVTQDFSPQEGFAGRSVGHGTLRFLLGKERTYRVESVGATQPDGSFTLDQKVYFQDEPPQLRHWVIRDAGAENYTFTLSDAAGPGVAKTDGKRLELDYPLKRGGIAMHQVMDLSADGKTIANEGRICIGGIPVGWLQETIRRVP